MDGFTIALIGNPNAGKTTLFNALTNSREYVGNWSGVTVEKTIGKLKTDNSEFEVVDLPGIYSLSPYSIEERVSKDFLVKDEPHMVINIVDASNLERNLYLTIQILELKRPTVVALNMMDALEASGNSIDCDALSEILGVPVVPISASKNTNIDKLIHVLEDGVHENIITSNSMEFNDYYESIKSKLNLDSNVEESQDLIEKRYSFINEVIKAVFIKNVKQMTEISDKVDAILTNRFLAIPIFLLVLFLLFQFTFSWIGKPLSDLLASFINGPFTDTIKSTLNGIGVAKWLKSLIIEGIIAGVGGIIIFFPLIFTLFFFISILEDSGYMARVAFIMDKFMKKLGLSGKAFIPMILGFGCTVPAIMAARTMENEKDKKLLTLIVPFMSCNARLPVYAFFAAIFFKGHETLVVFSLYLLGVCMAIGMGLLFKNTILKGDSLPFIMELPKYKLPKLSGLFINSWQRAKGFLEKAATIIFGMSVLIWFLSNYNFHGASELSNSFLAGIGGVLAPIFAPAGFGTWKAGVSLLTGLLAKEVVVSTLNVIYGANGIVKDFNPLSAYAFMVFVLLYTPCVSAVATVKKELNSIKWTVFSVVYQFLLAWIVSVIIYQIGKNLGL